VFRVGAVQYCVSFTDNRVGGASLAQTVTVLVAVGVFEVVAVRCVVCTKYFSLSLSLYIYVCIYIYI